MSMLIRGDLNFANFVFFVDGRFESSHGHLSNKKGTPGCLGYTGDEILPSDKGIIINQYKDPS